MLFNDARGRKVPHDLHVSLLPLNIDEPRHTAWSLAVGDVRPIPRPPDRPHRGQLPDVDLSVLVPDPSYVPLLGRLANLLRALAAGLDRLSARRGHHLGESA